MRSLPQRSTPPNRFRARSLAAAATAIGAAGASREATATIIYNPSVNASPVQSLSLDGSSDSEFDLVSMTGMMDDFDLGLEAADLGMMDLSSVVFDSFDGGMVDFLEQLTLHESVDATLNWTSEGWLHEKKDANPNWTAGETGYAGFRFESGGQNLYGWMEIELNATANDFTILSWAYQDDGSPINAGDTGVVPEPGTAMLLAVGLAGFAGLRKRRRS